MSATASLSRRRRLLLLTAALLAAVEVTGAVLTSTVVARSALADVAAQRAAAERLTAAQAAVLGLGSNDLRPAPAASRTASPWFRLAAEDPSLAARGDVRPSWRDDQLFEPVLPPPTPPASAQAPDPQAAPAGDATAAAAGGLAGAGRTAAAVAPRLRIPDLGISQSVLEFPCDRAQPPDNYVYRWGCAGKNNLYLLGHAASVFRPLHDAYVNGTLRVGMAAIWTDTSGRAVTYRVTSWRLVRPDDAAWAIASQPVPSMTLQTCYGANSEYRLLVRLVAS